MWQSLAPSLRAQFWKGVPEPLCGCSCCIALYTFKEKTPGQAEQRRVHGVHLQVLGSGSFCLLLIVGRTVLTTVDLTAWTVFLGNKRALNTDRTFSSPHLTSYLRFPAQWGISSEPVRIVNLGFLLCRGAGALNKVQQLAWNRRCFQFWSWRAAWRSRTADDPPCGAGRERGLPGLCCSAPRSEPPPVPPLHRYALLRKSKERQAVDGLNNLNYFANVTYDALYKNITVNLTPELAQVTEYWEEEEQSLASPTAPRQQPADASRGRAPQRKRTGNPAPPEGSQGSRKKKMWTEHTHKNAFPVRTRRGGGRRPGTDRRLSCCPPPRPPAPSQPRASASGTGTAPEPLPRENGLGSFLASRAERQTRAGQLCFRKSKRKLHTTILLHLWCSLSLSLFSKLPALGGDWGWRGRAWGREIDMQQSLLEEV